MTGGIAGKIWDSNREGVLKRGEGGIYEGIKALRQGVPSRGKKDKVAILAVAVWQFYILLNQEIKTTQGDKGRGVN